MSSPRLARLRASLYGSAAMLAVLLSAPTADAATLRAVGNAQASAFQRVQVQSQEFTDVDSQLIDAITRALADRGIQVDPNATMVLSFDTEISDLTEGPDGCEASTIPNSARPETIRTCFRTARSARSRASTRRRLRTRPW